MRVARIAHPGAAYYSSAVAQTFDAIGVYRDNASDSEEKVTVGTFRGFSETGVITYAALPRIP